ncbi:hypothetical protein FIBSPDRAFT_934348 [Athelia psychrophila]|uniref:Uncharacterized protein n=1 Tax=Athelia psychrophila TaxID=1759441 RepID=A0A166FLJ5_9AGAM|nr:hypothetical protein FIBSPDRAFT_934348 [Fibularhizoctonia sp. CBS 109695]
MQGDANQLQEDIYKHHIETAAQRADMSSRAALVDIAQLKESLGAMEVEETDLATRNAGSYLLSWSDDLGLLWLVHMTRLSMLAQCGAVFASFVGSGSHKLRPRKAGHDETAYRAVTRSPPGNSGAPGYMISNTIPRWRKLAIYEATPQMFHDVLAKYMKDQKAPLLEILDVQSDLDADFSGILEFFSRGAPKLRHVTFSGLSCYVPKCTPVTTLCLQDLRGTCIYKQIKDISSYLTDLHIYGDTDQLLCGAELRPPSSPFPGNCTL